MTTIHNAPAIPGYLLLLLAFFLGAMPFGFIAGKLRGIDLREQGSGNIGATNTLRVLGIGPGIAVFVLDAFKGYVVPAYALMHGMGGGWAVAAGLCAVLGHTYSPFVRFRGGKGVATSLGVLLALNPLVAILSLGVFGIVTYTTRLVSFGSLLAAATQALLFFILTPSEHSFQLFGVTAALFVFIRHRKNITRLLDGTEPRIGRKKEPDTTETGESNR